MFERITDYFLSHPRRLTGLGAFLVKFAGLLLVAGAIARVATTGTSVARGMASHIRSDVYLADIAPAVLTWWVPETLFGAVVVFFLMATGMVALQTGRRLQRFMD